MFWVGGTLAGNRFIAPENRSQTEKTERAAETDRPLGFRLWETAMWETAAETLWETEVWCLLYPGM